MIQVPQLGLCQLCLEQLFLVVLNICHFDTASSCARGNYHHCSVTDTLHCFQLNSTHTKPGPQTLTEPSHPKSFLLFTNLCYKI